MLKKRLAWVFYNKGEREDDNETGLKEGGGTEISTTVFPLRDARSLSLLIFTYRSFPQRY